MEVGKGKADRKSARGRGIRATGACTISLVSIGGVVGNRVKSTPFRDHSHPMRIPIFLFQVKTPINR